MRKSKWLWLAISLLMVGSLVAGCVAPGAAPVPAEGEAGAGDLAGAEITATYMQSGTYDKAAEALEPEFEDETGIKVELITAPWDVLNQNHITDLTTGTGAYDVMSGEFWIASVFDQMLPWTTTWPATATATSTSRASGRPAPPTSTTASASACPTAPTPMASGTTRSIFEECGVNADWETWDDYIGRAR